MKQFFITVAGVVAGLLLFFIGVPTVLIMLVAGQAKPTPTPSRAVLTLDLRQGISDQDPNNPLAGFGAPRRSVLSVVQALHSAETDDHVKGLLVRLPEGGLSPAVADELSLAIKTFRAAGKPVTAVSQGLYASGVTSSTYRLGAAANELWMQPGASLQATGIASEEVFFKRFFDRYGLMADFEKRYEYKNAVNPLTEPDYTPAHREATVSYMTSIYQSGLSAAAADRKMDAGGLRAALEAGPMSAEEALAAKLIDKVGHPRDAEQAMLKAAGDGAKLLSISDYRTRRTPAVEGKPGLALITAEGEISTGTSDNQGFNSQGGVYSDDVAKAFYDAIADKDVKAIVFRISSPGGSDTASEQILTAVKAAKAAGKPVVVSMGAYAASGGYWIASGATRIIAEPTTLTGSIGVFGGKFVLGEALSRYGVDMRGIKVGGDYADAFSSAQPFSPSQRAAVSRWMDKIYDGFVARVAEGRGLPPARVQEIAKGRVWTGVQAKDLGLVDEIGGFYQATAAAKRLGGLGTESVPIKVLPTRKSLFDLFGQMMGVGAEGVRVLGVAAGLMHDPQTKAVLDAVNRARLQSNGQGAVLADIPAW